MSLHLHHDEMRLVRYLRDRGLPDVQARIYTVVLCRQYRATREELASALPFYLSGADSEVQVAAQEIQSAVDGLLKLGLLSAIAGSEEGVEATSPWESAISRAFPGNVDADIKKAIDESLQVFTELSRHERGLIERLGWATWEKSRASYQDAIRHAKYRIRLGVYSSITFYDEVKTEIRHALVNRNRMEVQILMFSPDLAARLEGNPDLAKDVTQRTRDWKQLYAEARKEAQKKGNSPKFQIRHLQNEELAAFHRVLLLDDGDWVLNVHRSGIERGIQGIVYRGYAEEKHPSNLYNILKHYWEGAWESAVDPSWHKRTARWLKRYQYLFVLTAALALAWRSYRNPNAEFLRVKNDSWGSGLIGLVIAEIYNHVATITKDILELFAWLVALAQRVAVRDRNPP
jgi:hypothetical protein